jgi:hypothetical protein
MKNKISSPIVIMVMAFFVTGTFFIFFVYSQFVNVTINLDTVKSKKNIVMKKELDKETSDNFISLVRDICQGPNNTYYLNDANNHRIVQFTKDDKLLNSIGRWGERPGEFITPHCIKYYDNGKSSRLYVLDNNGTRLQMFDANGKYVENKRGIDISADFFDIDNDGNIIVPMRTDIEYFITKFSPTGEVLEKLILIDKNDPLLFKDEKKQLSEVIYDKKNDIYWLFFTTSPNIRIYNSKGDLVKEIKFVNESINKVYKDTEEIMKQYAGQVRMTQIFQRNVKLLPNGTIYVCLPFIINLELSYKNDNIHITKYEVKDIEGKITEDYTLSLINGKYYGFTFTSFFRE